MSLIFHLKTKKLVVLLKRYELLISIYYKTTPSPTHPTPFFHLTSEDIIPHPSYLYHNHQHIPSFVTCIKLGTEGIHLNKASLCQMSHQSKINSLEKVIL